MKQKQFRLELAIIIGIFFISMMIVSISSSKLETITSIDNSEDIDYERQVVIATELKPHTYYSWYRLNFGRYSADYVRVLHYMLKGWGYTSLGNEFGTKKYGVVTREKVAAFKVRVGLVIKYDIYYGRYVIGGTWTKLFKTIGRGSGRYYHVLALQHLLRYKFGYNVKVCGSFGPYTQWCVKDFQKSHYYNWEALEVDGWVGPKTWPSLLKSPVPRESKNHGGFSMGACFHDSGGGT